MAQNPSAQMTSSLSALSKQLKNLATASRREAAQRYFKTKKGEYGEGDRFYGVTVPDTRKVAKRFRHLELTKLGKLLSSPIHEERFVALVIMVDQFRHGSPAHQTKLHRLYISKMKFVNNWDLVDTSAPTLVGDYLTNRPRTVLKTWARSKNLWKRRVAVLATFSFIRDNDFKDALFLAKVLLNDPHDLMHKAVGWMLREVGNRHRPTEEAFLKQHYQKMPRTMLRYAIEKFPEPRRQAYLKGRA